MPDDERSGADRLLDLAVYAPLGLALEFRRMYPDLADRGRRQVTFTKALGRTAVTRGGAELRKRLRDEPESESAPSGAAVEPPPARPPEPREPAPTSTHLAIADYDSLSAQHVVKRLDGLSPNDLDAVRTYEERHRGRRTILTRVAQLQA